MDTEFQHVVTCRHNIESISKKYRDLGVPDEDAFVVIRVNKASGGADFVYSLNDQWEHHPDEAVDVSVAPVIALETEIPRKDIDVIPIQEKQCVNDDVIERIDLWAGTPTDTIGLFTSHFGKTHNTPIVRSGVIALMRDSKNLVGTRRGYMDAYLVESRSLGGLSGSPVIVQIEPFWTAGGKIKKANHGDDAAYLLGMVHGHFMLEDENDIVREDFPEEDQSSEKSTHDELNSGISVVIPIDKVIEAINQDSLMKKRVQIVEIRRKRSGVKEDSSSERTSGVDVPDHKERFNRLLNVAVKPPKSSDQT
jgi:hypothetical protein